MCGFFKQIFKSSCPALKIIWLWLSAALQFLIDWKNQQIKILSAADVILYADSQPLLIKNSRLTVAVERSQRVQMDGWIGTKWGDRRHFAERRVSLTAVAIREVTVQPTQIEIWQHSRLDFYTCGIYMTLSNYFQILQSTYTFVT